MLTRLLLIGIGGGIGSICRYALAGFVQRGSTAFPLGTLVVNVVGSLVLGFLFFRFEAAPIHANLRVAMLVGVLGGFTTYSTFALETLQLAERGAFLYAGLNALGTLASCLVGVWLGQRLALLLSTMG